MIRPRTKGPRSLTRTLIRRPFSRLITSTIEGSGKVVCAAEGLSMSKSSPSEVIWWLY